MDKHLLAVLVKNQFGVLNRVTSMFRRRQFNISSLTVSETESPEYSRITVIFQGEESKKQQLINQLYKLPDVCAIREMEKEKSVIGELLFIKMKNDPDTRGDIMAAADAFGAMTADYTRDAIILSLSAESSKLDEFIELMQDYDIIEICRTGCIALDKGSSTISDEL